MTFCSHCGYNLTRDEPVTRDGWSIGLVDGVRYQGVAVPVRPSQLTILHSLAAARGMVRSEVLLNRACGSEAGPKTLAVQVSTLRRNLTKAGLPVPIRTVHGTGYVWAGALADFHPVTTARQAVA